MTTAVTTQRPTPRSSPTPAPTCPPCSPLPRRRRGCSITSARGGPDFPDWDARFDALASALAALAAGGETGEVGE